MKKLICILLAACMLLALAACGETKPAEPEIKEWTRQGSFDDENGNHLLVNLSETEGYEGWGVSLMLDGEAIGWIIQQEGNALRGNLNGWDENMDPFNVTITEEGEDGLAFMLCCDDTVRENGSEAKANKMYDLCEQFNWVPISMKNDWTTIYGEGVTRVTHAP